MLITLYRNRTRLGAIDGRLVIDGRKVCDTVENGFRHLPAGIYQISTVKCPLAGRKIPVFRTAAGRGCSRCLESGGRQSCPRFRSGNGAHGLADCSVTVGRSVLAGVVVDSRVTFDMLCERMRKSLSRGKSIHLHIVETS